jgi:hypothetical protein
MTDGATGATNGASGATLPPAPSPPPQPVGIAITRFQVDNTIGQLARQIEAWSVQSESFNEWCITMTADALKAPPFNYTDDDVALLKSAANDLARLGKVYHGLEAVPDAYDFGTFARRTAGLLVPGMS